MSQVSVRRGSITTIFIVRPRALGGFEPLEQHGMAPGEIAADQHDEVGQLEVLVEAGHRVAAEGALVARHRRGHAEPRVGVDVGGAEEAFDQLVGGVIVLGQELARDIEGDGVGPVPRDDLAQAVRDRVERGLPRHALAVDLGMQQPVLERQRLAERRALGAEPAAIGGMLGIAGDRRPAPAVRRRHDPAADAAIGTGGADAHAASARSGARAARSRRASTSWRRQNSKKLSAGPARWASQAAEQLLQQRRQLVERDVAGILARHRLLGGRSRTAADVDVIALDAVLARRSTLQASRPMSPM